MTVGNAIINDLLATVELSFKDDVIILFKKTEHFA